jgi:hypothetical protein
VIEVEALVKPGRGGGIKKRMEKYQIEGAS